MFREQLFSKKESQGRAFNFKSGAFMTNMPLLKGVGSSGTLENYKDRTPTE